MRRRRAVGARAGAGRPSRRRARRRSSAALVASSPHRASSAPAARRPCRPARAAAVGACAAPSWNGAARGRASRRRRGVGLVLVVGRVFDAAAASASCARRRRPGRTLGVRPCAARLRLGGGRGRGGRSSRSGPRRRRRRRRSPRRPRRRRRRRFAARRGVRLWRSISANACAAGARAGAWTSAGDGPWAASGRWAGRSACRFRKGRLSGRGRVGGGRSGRVGLVGGAPGPGDARGELVVLLLVAALGVARGVRPGAARSASAPRRSWSSWPRTVATAPLEPAPRRARGARLLLDRLGQPLHEALVAAHQLDLAFAAELRAPALLVVAPVGRRAARPAPGRRALCGLRLQLLGEGDVALALGSGRAGRRGVAGLVHGVGCRGKVEIRQGVTACRCSRLASRRAGSCMFCCSSASIGRCRRTARSRSASWPGA